MNSLNKRLLWVSLFVLVAFLGAAGLALEKAFHQSLQQARQDRLQALLYSLLTAAELEPQGLIISASHPDERLFTPGSGLYAQVLDAGGSVVWSSDSLLGIDVSFERVLQPGASEFFTPPLNATSTLPLFAYAYGVEWQEPNKPEREFTIIIGEEQGVFEDQIQAFRANLWMALGLVTIVLLIALAAVVRWGLAPLRTVERDIAEIESGKSELLEGDYPQELQGLTRNLNKLIQNERNRMQHYRNTLANLAHSLKTPLAVLQNGLDAQREPEMVEQLQRMNKLVEYQLQRAVATGQPTFSTPVIICPLVEKLLESLNKVYREKDVSAILHCDPGLAIRANEGDLMEVFGNLLDNAYKWCKKNVQVTLTRENTAQDAGSVVRIEISDDGPGISLSEVTRVQMRGERNDTHTPGQGIGLAVVADIVNAYHGKIKIDQSTLGGARAHIELPTK